MTINCSKLRGNFTRKISVTTNDPEHANEALYCKGHMLEPFKMNPKHLSFGRISRRTPATREVTLTPGDGGPLHLKLKPVATEGVVAELREVKPGEEYQLKVTLQTPFKSERIKTKIELETGLSQVPVAKIPIYAFVQPKLSLVPPRFVVPADRKGDWEQTVRVEWDDDQPHKILTATVSDPGLKVRLEEKDGVPQIVLSVPADYETAAATRRNVVVTTDDEEKPRLQVPITFRRSRASMGSASSRRVPPTRTPAGGKTAAKAKTRSGMMRVASPAATRSTQDETTEAKKKPAKEDTAQPGGST